MNRWIRRCVGSRGSTTARIRTHRNRLSAAFSTSVDLGSAQETLSTPFSNAFLQEWLPTLTPALLPRAFSHLVSSSSHSEAPNPGFHGDPATSFAILPLHELERMAFAWKERARWRRIRDLIAFCTGEEGSSTVVEGRGALPLDAFYRNILPPPREGEKNETAPASEREGKGKEQLFILWVVQVCLSALGERAAAEFPRSASTRTANHSDLHNHETTNANMESGRSLRCAMLHEELARWLSTRVLPLLWYFAAPSKSSTATNGSDETHGNGGVLRKNEETAIADARRCGENAAEDFPVDAGLTLAEQLRILHASLVLVCFNVGILNHDDFFGKKGATETPPPPQGARRQLDEDLLTCSWELTRMGKGKTDPFDPSPDVFHARMHDIFRRGLPMKAENNEKGELASSLICARALRSYFLHAEDSIFAGERISLRFPFSHLTDRRNTAAVDDDARIEQLNEQLSRIALHQGEG
ncbi:unnamed protein product [Phytomonas sp. EM1]|nr:unnamed protein product [Phytomonas sp. EM1]|eukprot:CCW65140.1 unnamed protein product [Phytomonas sp. isolate EM1]